MDYESRFRVVPEGVDDLNAKLQAMYARGMSAAEALKKLGMSADFGAKLKASGGQASQSLQQLKTSADAGTAAIERLAQAQRSADATSRGLANSVQFGSRAIQGSASAMYAARLAAADFSGSLTGVARGLAMLAAQSQTLGPILQAALPISLAVGFGMVLETAAKKAMELYDTFVNLAAVQKELAAFTTSTWDVTGSAIERAQRATEEYIRTSKGAAEADKYRLGVMASQEYSIKGLDQSKLTGLSLAGTQSVSRLTTTVRETDIGSRVADINNAIAQLSSKIAQFGPDDKNSYVVGPDGTLVPSGAKFPTGSRTKLDLESEKALLQQAGAQLVAEQDAWRQEMRTQSGRITSDQTKIDTKADKVGIRQDDFVGSAIRGFADQDINPIQRIQLEMAAKLQEAKQLGISGSRAQAARLIRCYQGGGEVKPRAYQRQRFTNRYTRADVELLAVVDEAHETLSGPATQKILQRAWHEYHDAQYERLARLSVAQLYRLRKSGTYRHRRIAYQPTRPTQVAIGERRKPDPQGRPGYLRVDTVHQGDLDGAKGLYHINAVDEVTQWQVVGATAQISEAWLIPVLEGMLAQFPFHIRGFHSDNGSEFINHTVAQMLNKLLVEQTKSRPRHSNDNGLAETKNGWVIRKHIGYGHIASVHAEAFDEFYRLHFNPYLNFHRPCGVPEVTVTAKGKQKRVYRWYAPPWEILRQLSGLAGFLRTELTVDQLQQTAAAKSDTHAATEMREAKRKLFARFQHQRSA